ncbi:MAG: phosphate ABC transporter permease PstA [Ilumatobacteraceae bacterium]
MSVTAIPAAPQDRISVETLKARRGRRSVVNAVMLGLMGLAFLAILIPLAFVIGSVVSKGAGIVFRDFPDWFTTRIPIQSRKFGPGMAPAIVGTLLITATASAIAIPLGILGAVYLNEYGKNGALARTIRFLANVMTGVPSIVMGLFIYVLFTLRFGLSGLGGALALACLMLPVVIRSSEEMLRLVPDNLREASYALGTRKSRTILGIVLPTALPGIVSGCLLAVARAAGETAPLLFTIGVVTKTRTNVFEGANTALPAQIFSNILAGKPGSTERAWGAALTLVTLTFLFTVIARLVTSAYQKRR